MKSLDEVLVNVSKICKSFFLSVNLRKLLKSNHLEKNIHKCPRQNDLNTNKQELFVFHITAQFINKIHPALV